MSKALEGVRVIDMTHNQAGPACTQIMAFLGADVIKLENPKGGDIARVVQRDQDSDSLFFLVLNANKRSLTLNLKTDEGKELFKANGSYTIEEIIVANSHSEVTLAMPSELTLSRAYPNPFNPSTSLDVFVPADGFVSLNVYNVMGQLVDVIHSGSMTTGNHSITWNASDMTSGVYFVRAESADGMSVQKVMLMK